MYLPVLLFAVGAAAGFIDAIAGGGGLLTLPALLLTGLPPQLALGTNKGQSVFGSGTALHRFWGSTLLDRRRAAVSLIRGLLGSALGVALVSHLSQRLLTPLVMCLLATVAILMVFQRPPPVAQPPCHRSAFLAISVAFTIAAYDGFFGPGTGTFLILAYAYLWHDPLDAASANAKVVNFASNLAALICFAWRGLILWHLAIPMALGQILGGRLGAHVTIRAGRPLVRWTVAAVSTTLLCRLGWQLLH